MTVVRKEFDQIITGCLKESSSLLQSLCTKSLSGNLGQSTIRSIIWKVFLGILPISGENTLEEWNVKIDSDRKRYNALIEKHESDPRKKGGTGTSGSEEVDVTFCDPLSQSQQVGILVIEI